MEREIIDLRRQVASANTANRLQQTTEAAPLIKPEPRNVSPKSHYMQSHEVVASLLDLRSGFELNSPGMKRLEDVNVTADRVNELFHW